MTEDPRFWRVRLKCNENDDTKAIWSAGLIGIWYGPWAASTLDEFIKLKLSDEEVFSRLSIGNSWLKKRALKTIWTFWELRESVDWVFTSFAGSIHVAQPTSAPFDQDRFAHGSERLKARRVGNVKSFQLSLLPDCFQLLAAAGQGTLHQVHGTRRLVELLCKSRDESDLMERWAALSLATKIEALGPRSWETLCEAYLIIEEGFVPVGLGVGRTLPVFDLVGRSRTGTHLYAQCKGDRNEVQISDQFLSQSRQLPPDQRKVFFFAYKGVTTPPEIRKDVTVLTNENLLSWRETTERGREYLNLLTS